MTVIDAQLAAVLILASYYAAGNQAGRSSGFSTRDWHSWQVSRLNSNRRALHGPSLAPHSGLGTDSLKIRHAPAVDRRPATVELRAATEMLGLVVASKYSNDCFSNSSGSRPSRSASAYSRCSWSSLLDKCSRGRSGVAQ